MGDEQADQRDQHPLRTGEAQGLRLVPADELDEEAEDAGGQQVQLQGVPDDRARDRG